MEFSIPFKLTRVSDTHAYQIVVIIFLLQKTIKTPAQNEVLTTKNSTFKASSLPKKAELTCHKWRIFSQLFADSCFNIVSEQ